MTATVYSIETGLKRIEYTVPGTAEAELSILSPELPSIWNWPLCLVPHSNEICTQSSPEGA